MIKIILLIIILCLPSYAQDRIVAEFGNHKITLNEFRIAYLDLIKKPDIFDSKDLREEFLDELIARRLLAEEAKQQGIDNNELFQYKVLAYKDKCLREEHFDNVIKPKIIIDEKDIEDAYQFTQEERRISHLFCESKSQSDSLYNLLKNGADFSQLAKNVFTDTILTNSGGDIGWVNWEQLDYELAMTAFREALDTFSKPVKSQFGYHIIRVTGYKKKPLITRLEYELHKNKAKNLLQQKIGDMYAHEYVNEMMKKAKITVYPQIMKVVGEKLKANLHRKPDKFNESAEVQLKDEEIRFLEQNLWDMRNEELANINGMKYTVGDFLGAINHIPYLIVYSNYKTTLDYGFRDFLLTQEAGKLGLDSLDLVIQKTNLFSESLLDLAMRREIVRNVKITEEEIKSYYEEKKESFTPSSYESVKDFIKEFLLGEKKRQAIHEYVKAKTKDMEIKKYLTVIHEYYDGVYAK